MDGEHFLASYRIINHKKKLTKDRGIVNYTPRGYIMNDERRKILSRLRRIEGQLRGLQRMVEKETPCADVLTQVSAVTSAMKKTGIAIVQNHLRQCILESSQGSDQALEGFQKAIARYIDMA
jgi:CsoR family transcriptional regulator, copper-sensing transcriptional repressor